MSTVPAKAPEKKPDPDAARGEATVMLIGRLRRDTMILAASADEGELRDLGERAVKEGRAAEVYIVPVLAYFTESTLAWIDPDDPSGARTASQGGVLVNPAFNKDGSVKDQGPGNTLTDLGGAVSTRSMALPPEQAPKPEGETDESKKD